jgi:hypothetical protein
MKKILKYLCPHTWFKKRQIIFYSKYPYGEHLNPILRSSDVKMNWFAKAQKTFQEKLEKNKNNQHMVASGHRCLGINAIMNTGFILRSHVEFAVESTEEDFKIHSKGIVIDTTIELNPQNHDYSIFPKHLLGDFVKPKNAMKDIIKVSLPWFFQCPKDIVFLILPVPYNDDDRFIGATAILDPMYSLELNISLWWLCKNSYEVVKADTPLVQMIPIPRKPICDSFKMTDIIPEFIYKKDFFRGLLLDKQKCPYYSQYKKISEKVFDLK